MKCFSNTPWRQLWRTGLLVISTTALSAQPVSARVQPAPAAPLLDALSLTLQLDTVGVARGSVRLRQYRTGNGLELVATGIVQRRGLRVTAELRTDSLFGLRRYTTESRDSTGVVIDRIQVTSSGGRVTLERVTAKRRQVREYIAQRDLMILDAEAVVPFVMLAALPDRIGAVALLDVRSGTVSAVRLASGTPVPIAIAEVSILGSPVTVSGLTTPLVWWRDGKGHLLRVGWGAGHRALRDDPPS